jgi:hypothetical protein
VTVLKLADSRTIRVTGDEIVWEYGRVIYTVDKVGCFTIERDHFGNIDQRADSLYIAYGRIETEHHPRAYDSPVLPDAPVVNGVQLGNGGCGFNPDKLSADPDGRGYLQEWPVFRPANRGLIINDPVSDATRKRVKYICVALMSHYLNRPDYPAIERARARYLAPTRLRQHTERITELRAQIAQATAELDVQLKSADYQALMTRPTVDAT